MLQLPATLTHAVATQVAASLQPVVNAQPAEVVVDASALKEFDSSALAVLLDCRRAAQTQGKTFSVQNLPPRLRQLAGLYGVAGLIPETA